ncbi:hypothetical protein Lser_V15G27859 [Lactuca serriola]
MTGASNLTKLIKPTKRLQATDIQAAAGWGVVALTGAIWVVQPFDWVRKTFFEKPEPEN